MPSIYPFVEHFEKYNKTQIQQGRYTSASEVLRDGLRALEDREKYLAAKSEALRSDIQQGINSGPVRPLRRQLLSYMLAIHIEPHRAHPPPASVPPSGTTPRPPARQQHQRQGQQKQQPHHPKHIAAGQQLGLPAHLVTE